MEYLLLIASINNADTTILFYNIALYMITTNHKKQGYPNCGIALFKLCKGRFMFKCWQAVFRKLEGA